MLTLIIKSCFYCCLILQVAKKHRYKFSVIVHELRTAELVGYKTILIALINCILVATDDLEERVRLRNQFIGELFNFK